MSRKIYVSSDISLDEALEAVAGEDPLAALLWPWLLPHLDDWGRGLASASRIRAKVFPNLSHLIDKQLVENALCLFAKHGLIRLYEVDGDRFLAVSEDAWWRIQTHIRFRKQGKEGSRFPPPPENPANDHLAEVSTGERNCAQVRTGDSQNCPSTLPPFHPSTLHKKSPNGLSSGEPDMAAEVFAYWQEVMGHPQAKLKGDRRQKIQSRLKEGYSAEQLKQAVDGCRASPHHRGENDTGTVYDSIGLIFRNAEKVEWFMAMAPGGRANGGRAWTEEERTRIRDALELYNSERYAEAQEFCGNDSLWLEVMRRGDAG